MAYSASDVSMLPLDLPQAVVADPEMMGDLVEHGVLDGTRKDRAGRVRPDVRTAEDGDLARDRRVRGTPW